MRKLFIFAFLANMALNIISLMYLPARVAIHFGGGGIADSWAPKEVNAVIFLAVQLLLFFSLLYTPSSVFKFPPAMINLPNKDYWLKEENRPRALEKFSAYMWEFGIALFAFLFWVELLVLDANFANPVRLKEGLLWFGLIAFILYSLYWCAKFFRALRIPPGAPTR